MMNIKVHKDFVKTEIYAETLDNKHALYKKHYKPLPCIQLLHSHLHFNNMGKKNNVFGYIQFYNLKL